MTGRSMRTNDEDSREPEQSEQPEQPEVLFSRSRTFLRAAEQLDQQWREREVKAAERSARWAKVSMIVSTLALSLSAWPYVVEWLR